MKITTENLLRIREGLTKGNQPIPSGGLHGEQRIMNMDIGGMMGILQIALGDFDQKAASGEPPYNVTPEEIVAARQDLIDVFMAHVKVDGPSEGEF